MPDIHEFMSTALYNVGHAHMKHYVRMLKDVFLYQILLPTLVKMTILRLPIRIGSTHGGRCTRSINLAA